MPVIVILIAAILSIAAERACDSRFFQTLWSLSYYDRAVLIGLACLPLLIVLALTLLRRQPASSRMVTNTLIVAVLAGGIVAFLKLISSGENTAPAVAILAAAAATIGWLMQRQAAIEISRKQHTLTILLQLRQSELFNKHRAKIFSKWPDVVSLSPESAAETYAERLSIDNYAIDPNTGLQKLPLIESIRYICNYYEFLAAAIYHGDIDDALLKTSIGPLMAQTYYKFENLIELTMTKTGRGTPTPSSAYFNLWWLIKRHWKIDRLVRAPA